MIIDRDKIYSVISHHAFVQDRDTNTFLEKIDNLEHAIDSSVYRIGNEILMKQSKIHLSLSGGMDSSTLLLTMIEQGYPVTAHTIAGYSDHPDIYHSTFLTRKLGVQHNIYVLKPTSSNLNKSKYLLLFDAVKDSARTLVCGDCIDEQLGGYYPHQNPMKLQVYDASRNVEENRLYALKYFMGRLVHDHLSIQDRCSNKCNIDIYLPYGDPAVFRASSTFLIDELVDDNYRKKPMRVIAERKGVPSMIINRRKLGLVQAMDAKVNMTFPK